MAKLYNLKNLTTLIHVRRRPREKKRVESYLIENYYNHILLPYSYHHKLCCPPPPPSAGWRMMRLKSRNMSTIQLPLRHLKGVCIKMTPLSDWLNMLLRVRGIAEVTELPLPPKGMLYCNSIKKLWEDVHANSKHVRDLHKTILFTCKACMSFVTCLLNIGVPC